MTHTHWKKLTNPDYLGAYALEPGQDIVATIKSVGIEQVMGTDGKKEECTVAHFVEAGIKPMILNVTNCKTLEKLYKTPYIEDWAGRKMQIGVESVKAFGDVVDALRVRKFLPRMQGQPRCAECGEEIIATEKMTAVQIIAATQKRYGKPMCADCWVKLMEAAKTDSDAPERSEGANAAD